MTAAEKITTHEKLIHFNEKLGYAAGDMASCLYYSTFALFLMIFYTDTFGMSAATVGTMLLVTRIWDTVNDPLMGMIADRTRSRLGKFRPWLLWMAVPFAVIGILTFTTPNFNATGKLIYAYISYTLATMIYTAINIPYGALLGVMTPHSEERTTLSSFRFIGAFIGNLVVQGTLLYLVKFFGQGNDQRGYQLAIGLYGIMAAGLFLFTFSQCKERVQPPREQHPDAKRDLSDLVHNRPWLVLCLLGIISLIWISIRNASILYYFKYYVGGHEFLYDQVIEAEPIYFKYMVGAGGADLNLFFKIIKYYLNFFVSSDEKASLFMVIGTLFTILGVMSTPVIIKLLGGKKRAFIILNSINIITLALFYLARPTDIFVMYITHITGSYFMGPVFPMIWAMYADTADYAEWKFGRRATGLIFSAATFSQKLGWTVGGSIAAFILSVYSYQPNVAQTPKTLYGIRMMMSILPAFGAVLVVAAAFLYNLDTKKQHQIEMELLRRKNAYPEVQA